MKTLLTIILGTALLLAGCATTQVSQDHGPAIDFSVFTSYGWQDRPVRPDADVRVSNPLLRERFHRNIDQVLAEKGLSPSDKPDLLISYEYTISSRIDSDPYGADIEYGLSRRSTYGGVTFGDLHHTRQYDIGILVIDITDARRQTPLWRGTGSEIVSIHTTPEAQDQFVARLVRAILAQYPPQPGK